VKLLFDANLSPSLPHRLADLFPGSRHVFEFGELQSDDYAIWDFAKAQGYTIVTKDADFRTISVIRGAPPLVIWLRLGNADTDAIEILVRDRITVIASFESNPQSTFLALRPRRIT
jgi:predicted nuclease of predicted toxin-antitoxin system